MERRGKSPDVTARGGKSEHGCFLIQAAQNTAEEDSTDGGTTGEEPPQAVILLTATKVSS